MPATTSTIDLVIARRPAGVFDALTRLGGLRARIGTSRTYAGTVDVSDEPVQAGSTYTDRTPIGRLRGEVLELGAERRVVFRQATASGDLDVRITYELERAPNGTRLVRTGEITTRSWLAILHPIVVWTTRSENRRTMERLSASLEAA